MPTALMYRDAPIVRADPDRRTITVQLCAWSTPADVVEEDGTRYREQYEPGALELAPAVHVVDRHHGSLIGRADPDTFDPAGPTVDLIVAPTAAGRDAMALVDAGVIRSVSIEIEDVPGGATVDRASRLVTRTRALVHGVALAFRPQLDAPILAVRETPTDPDPDPDDPEPEPDSEDPDMPVIDTPTIPDRPPAGAGDDLVTGALLTRSLDLLRDEIRRDVIAGAPGEAGHALARFRSLDEYTTAAYSDPSLRGLLVRALVDQITTNNPGVIPPGWVTQVYGIVDRGRPTITAFGTAPLPDAGMDVNWPYFNGDLLALVGEQTAQKTAITSVRVDLLRGTENLRTWAGGSDISYQLLRRSEPSYRDAYMRIMFAAYAAVTNVAAGADVVAAATGHVEYDLAGDTTGDAFRAALFAASVAVQTATGAPASFVLAASDVFVKLGGMPGLFPATYGTANVSGTADASSLSINVSGLQVIHDAGLPAGTLIVSNSIAADWFEDGPFTVAAEDVEKLGQNVAVWGLGAFAAQIPAGIVVLSDTIPLTATRSSRSSKSAD